MQITKLVITFQFLALFFLLLLSACEKNSMETTLNGFYSKGPVDHALCQIMSSNGEAVSDQTLTSLGHVSFQNISHVGIAYLECIDGNYTDEASQSSIDNTGVKMRSVIEIEENKNNSVVVTPYTEISFQLAEADGDIKDFEQHNANVALAFGLKKINISSTIPSDLHSISGSKTKQDRYGTYLAAFSQLMFNNDNKISISKIISDYANKLSNQSLSVDSFNKALSDLTRNPNTLVSISDISSLVIKNSFTGEDADNDVLSDAIDNCPNVANQDQADNDLDGIGDLCDEDNDNDGVNNNDDAFPFDEEEQFDTDLDGIGNSADLDDDNDGLEDDVDNCDLIANVDQENFDNDALGDLCDEDDDNDSVLDVLDDFPLDATESIDSDKDGIGNNADLDDDNDSIADTNDNCSTLSNVDQLDFDSDNLGDACDIDDDNDGANDAFDSFPFNALEQLDTDGDGLGNNSDLDDDNDNLSDELEIQLGSNPLSDDTDNDTIRDDLDNCPTNKNQNQIDKNNDNIGDACTIKLSSSSIKLDDDVALTQMCETLSGDNYSPQLSWENFPSHTNSFAIIMDDETSPCGEGEFACVHWGVFNIPKIITDLDENIDLTRLNDAITQGLNLENSQQYTGPCSTQIHNYTLAIYALSDKMPILDGDKALTREEFQTEYAEYILNQDAFNFKFNPQNLTASFTAHVHIADGLQIDGDTNDANSNFIPNNSFSAAQILQAPINVTGYVTERPTKNQSDRFEKLSDKYDYYKVQLNTQLDINLEISNYKTDFSNDLDIFLYSVSNTNEPIATSVGTGKFESIQVPENGDFYLVVKATSGASNYLIDISVSDSQRFNKDILRLEDDFIADEIIISHKNISLNFQQLSKQFHNFDMRQNTGSGNKLKLIKLTKKPELRKSSTTINDTPNLKLGRFQKKNDTIMALKKMRASAEINSADLNYIRKPFFIPNDSRYKTQWSLPFLNLPQAWEFSRGENITVAVLDTGVFLTHPDLANNIRSDGFDFISNKQFSLDGDGIDANPDDPGDNEETGVSSFHGTHVAGIIAASSNNNQGISGVAGEATILPIRVLGKLGGSDYDIQQGIRYAAGLPNNSRTLPDTKADIINLSLGGPGYSQSLQNAIDDARSAGVIIVAAAGNDATALLNYPASYDGVISVSSVGASKKLAPYSSFGSKIDITAPGGDKRVDFDRNGIKDGIISTVADDTSGNRTSTYKSYQGTSMAAPHVSGVIALMKSIFPEMTPQQLDTFIENGEITNNINQDQTKMRSDEFGYGLVDALKAVQIANNFGNPQELPPILATSISSAIMYEGTNTLEFTISNLGGGEFGILSYDVNKFWASISPKNIGSNGLGTYTLSINRSSLAQGNSTLRIEFVSSTGAIAYIDVTIIVGSVISSIDVGFQYLLLIDKFTGKVSHQLTANAVGGSYEFFHDSIPVGSYYVTVGTDNDNDLEICGDGEFCGNYPVNGLLESVDLMGDVEIEFTTSFNPQTYTRLFHNRFIPQLGNRKEASHLK